VAQQTRSRPAPLVRRKQGPIVNLGPIVATVTAHNLAAERLRSAKRAGVLAAAVAGVLLRREIRPLECDGWRTRMSSKPPDSEMARMSPSPANLCEAVTRRWKHGYDMALSTWGWKGILGFIDTAPEKVFDFAANRRVISSLYGVDWGLKPKRIE